jgi:hypothetical protein
VFKVEDLEVYENDFQTQRVKLALSPALWNISQWLEIKEKIFSMTKE